MPYGNGGRGMKNKFRYYSVLSYISTGFRCPAVEPLVFDPVPLAKLSHAQSGCYISSHGKLAGSYWEVGVSYQLGLKMPQLKDNLHYRTYLNEVRNVCHLPYGDPLSFLHLMLASVFRPDTKLGSLRTTSFHRWIYVLAL